MTCGPWDETDRSVDFGMDRPLDCESSHSPMQKLISAISFRLFLLFHEELSQDIIAV